MCRGPCSAHHRPANPVPIHWLLPNDDAASSAVALVDSLSSPDAPAAGAGGAGGGAAGAGQAAEGGAAAAAVAAQQLADATCWEVLSAAVGALPGLGALQDVAGAALLAGAGSLAALAVAGPGELLKLCGSDEQLAGKLWEFFGGGAAIIDEAAAAEESSGAVAP